MFGCVIERRSLSGFLFPFSFPFCVCIFAHCLDAVSIKLYGSFDYGLSFMVVWANMFRLVIFNSDVNCELKIPRSAFGDICFMKFINTMTTDWRLVAWLRSVALKSPDVLYCTIKNLRFIKKLHDSLNSCRYFLNNLPLTHIQVKKWRLSEENKK